MTDRPKRAMTMREIREGLGHVQAGQPDVTVTPTRYAVSCFPPDDHENAVFNLAVEYRGRGLWAVTRGGFCLSSDGTWSYESIPSDREDEWLAEHRFDLDTALKLAKEAAPKVAVNGFTVADALRMAQQREEAGRG